MGVDSHVAHCHAAARNLYTHMSFQKSSLIDPKGPHGFRGHLLSHAMHNHVICPKFWISVLGISKISIIGGQMRRMLDVRLRIDAERLGIGSNQPWKK